MTEDIAQILVDADDRLCVSPRSASFPFIYRAAMEVGWDSQARCLYSPAPGEWSHVRWYHQIVAAVKDEYGITLVITPETRWHNVAESLRSELAPGVGGIASA